MTFYLFLNNTFSQKNMCGMNRTRSRWGQPSDALPFHSRFTIPRPNLWWDANIETWKKVLNRKRMHLMAVVSVYSNMCWGKLTLKSNNLFRSVALFSYSCIIRHFRSQLSYKGQSLLCYMIVRHISQLFSCNARGMFTYLRLILACFCFMIYPTLSKRKQWTHLMSHTQYCTCVLLLSYKAS